ncbi:MAG TPA: tRNA (adenosine(37)-N6)-threonylcarbamoyltransferase complex ATPase subunit type 1 TsaE [bacterium]|nr:tRNA (adenosine(37)-N6)-threonylcarbamoyltransferase complex ATPase subunit type 1 TsaE [bacterium]
MKKTSRMKPRRSASTVTHEQFLTKSEKETFKKAQEFGRTLERGDVVALNGELGSGKSVFTRGLLHSLGVRHKYLASPTFTLINMYRGDVPVYHFDVYRFEDPRELDGLGYEEFFFGEGVTIVEWADKVAAYLPRKHIRVSLKVLSETGRLIVIDRKGGS